MNLLTRVRIAIEQAISWSWDNMKEDGHWCGEIRANATVTAEHIFLYASLGHVPPGGYEPFQRYLLSQQNKDGSWGLAPHYPGDLSTTCEAYLALKICGSQSSDAAMQQAKEFILSTGGMAKVRMFTRIFFATFGLFPWTAVPYLPPEFILLPTWCSLNIYKFSSWARSTIIPLMLIRHHEPVYSILELGDAQVSWLDELWLHPENKMIQYSPSFWELRERGIASLLFGVGDKILHWTGGLKGIGLGSLARWRCVDWILKHQEKQGDWAGIIMPMVFSIQALLLEGYTINSPEIEKGLAAIERFSLQDREGKRIQACVSPHWDTVLMVAALCDGAQDFTAPSPLFRSIEWIKLRQLLGLEGDWRVYKPQLHPGGFSFEHNNSWYPDVDDTAATIIALLKHDPHLAHSEVIHRAANWIVGMQNKDGGWAAFDTDNDKLWLNQIPFSDMDALCDPSTADITGRVLEAFGYLLNNFEGVGHVGLYESINAACSRGVVFLSKQQEPNGSWFGRWGCNYLYGTSSVLCGLERFSRCDEDVQVITKAGVKWLLSVQNSDGGWGEDLMSYKDKRQAARGSSTPSQTSWGLMGLLAHLPAKEDAIVKGVQYLVSTQVVLQPDGHGGSWIEKTYTGTGFPKHFYFGYDLYRHYFPLMALGRYMKTCEDVQSLDSGVAGV